MVRLKEKGSVKHCFYWFAICVPLRFLAQGIHMALHSECPAAAAMAGALLIYGLLVVSFGKPLVILQAFVGAMIGLIWIMSAVCTVLFGSSFFCGLGTQVVDSLVAAERRLVLGLRREEATHCVSLALCVRPWPPRRCGHVLGLRVGGAPRGASLALCGRPCWHPRNMALELFEARWRPHYASQAEASPRVDVGEVSQAPGDKAARHKRGIKQTLFLCHCPDW